MLNSMVLTELKQRGSASVRSYLLQQRAFSFVFNNKKGLKKTALMVSFHFYISLSVGTTQ